MHRITEANRHVDKFGVGKDGFRDGDKSSGVIATRPGAITFDVQQEELVNAVEGAGLTLSVAGGDYAQLREAIKRLAGGMLPGSRTGLFSRTSNDQITLSPVSGSVITVEIDGVLRSASSLVWDLTTDLDTGAAAANTVYYAYALVTGGALDTKLSVTPPSTSGKVGYHPTRTSERCVFAVRTKAGSAAWVGFDEMPDGWVILRSGEFAYADLGISEPANYTSQAITLVPACARAVRMSVSVTADDIAIHYAHESLVGSAVTSFPGIARVMGDTVSTTNAMSDSSVFDMPVDSTPSFAWGAEQIGGTTNVVYNRWTVIGWRNAL